MTFLCTHADAIEADYRLRPGGDLWADIGNGILTLRQVKVWIEHLPEDAATWVSVHGPLATWRRIDHLMARAVLALEGANWQRSGGKGRRPKAITPPPSIAAAAKTAEQIEDVKRRIADRQRRKERLARQRARRGKETDG